MKQSNALRRRTEESSLYLFDPTKRTHDDRRRKMKEDKKLRRGLTDPESKEWQEHRFVLLRRIIGKKPQGRPTTPSPEDLAYENIPVSLEPTAEYTKNVDHVVRSLGVERSDAEYAINEIGPFQSLISLAYSMHINYEDLTFREAAYLVNKGAFTEEDKKYFLENRKLFEMGSIDEQVLKPETVLQEPPENSGLNLGYLLAIEFPDRFSDLPEDESERLNHRLYGKPVEDIIDVMEESLEQDL